MSIPGIRDSLEIYSEMLDKSQNEKLVQARFETILLTEPSQRAANVIWIKSKCFQKKSETILFLLQIKSTA